MDDEPEMVRLLQRTFIAHDFQVCTITSAEEGLMTEPVTALIRLAERLPSIRAGRSAHFAQPKHTKQASSVDWDDFVLWCILHGCEPMPTMPKSIAASLASPASGSATPTAIMRQGYWSSRAMVDRDARHGTLWQECAAACGGL